MPTSPEPARASLLQRLLTPKNKVRTMADQVMRAIFVLMLGGLGVMLIVVGAREFFAQRHALMHAEPIEATIISTRVVTSKSMDTDQRLLRDNSTTSHTPEVRFIYVLDGTRYESDQLDATVIVHAYASADEAAREIAPYTPGQRVRAYVDRTEPQRAFLRLEHSSGPVWFIVAGCLTFGLLAILWRFL
jgi:hypothetical protein